MLLFILLGLYKYIEEGEVVVQVFELQPYEEYQLVYNKQDSPPAQLECRLKLDSKEQINCKVWGIDSEEYATMLVSSNYSKA